VCPDEAQPRAGESIGDGSVLGDKEKTEEKSAVSVGEAQQPTGETGVGDGRVLRAFLGEGSAAKSAPAPDRLRAVMLFWCSVAVGWLI